MAGLLLVSVSLSYYIFGIKTDQQLKLCVYFYTWM